MNPELPVRALPAAWRMLRAAGMDATPDNPCYVDHNGDCQNHSWSGIGADELARAAGVDCLSQISARVVEAEERHEQFRQSAAQQFRQAAARAYVQTAAPIPLTLANLWQAMEQHGPDAAVVRHAVLKAVSLMDQRDGEALSWQAYVERAVLLARASQ